MFFVILYTYYVDRYYAWEKGFCYSDLYKLHTITLVWYHRFIHRPYFKEVSLILVPNLIYFLLYGWWWKTYLLIFLRNKYVNLNFKNFEIKRNSGTIVQLIIWRYSLDILINKSKLQSNTFCVFNTYLSIRKCCTYIFRYS